MNLLQPSADASATVHDRTSSSDGEEPAPDAMGVDAGTRFDESWHGVDVSAAG
jgi:hypothetical protein